MRRARTATPGVVTTVVLPADQHEALRTLCAALDTSMRAFITRAVADRMTRFADNAAGV
jgi:hypothetical protein